MEVLNKKQLLRCFFKPTYICSLFSVSKPLFHFQPSAVSSICESLYPIPTLLPFYSHITSSGPPSSWAFTVSYSRFALRTSCQIRVFGVSSSRIDDINVSGSDDPLLKVTSTYENVRKACPELVSEIVEAIRSDEDEQLEKKLSSAGEKLSISCVNEIFRVLNSEKVSGLRFFVWAEDRNPDLFKKADFYSFVINNCGCLEDYEAMLRLLMRFSRRRICLAEQAFGFISVLGQNKELMMESIRKVVDLLKEAGGSCRGTGIFGLIKMLLKLDLFEMAVFVIKITEKKLSYYNILVLEKCRRSCFDEARGLLEVMHQSNCGPNVLSYNYIISALCKNGKTTEACDLLKEMEDKGCTPDAISFEIIVFSMCRLGKVDVASQYFDEMVSKGLEPRARTNVALIECYFYLEKYDEAYKFVVKLGIEHKNYGKLAYGSLAGLHVGKGDVVTAGNLLIEMMGKNFIPHFRNYRRITKGLFELGHKQLVEDINSRFSQLRGPKVPLKTEISPVT